MHHIKSLHQLIRDVVENVYNPRSDIVRQVLGCGEIVGRDVEALKPPCLGTLPCEF